MTIGAAQQFFLGASKATGGGAAGYQIERSLRFNSSDSAYLSRTPAVTGNRRTWTWAGWVKRSAFGGFPKMFGTYTGASYIGWDFGFRNDDRIEINYDDGSGYVIRKRTTPVYRDPSAWYHLVLAVDTTQAVSNNSVKLYVNGSQVTAFDTNDYTPAPNYDTNINTSVEHRIGYNYSYSDFYLADIHFIDGQALTPSSFTEVSATTGQLIPKTYTGTFGTNGFWLKFSDNSAATAAALGNDYSGNNNDWTPNNLSVTAGAGNDSLVDTPTSYGTDTGVGGEVRGNYCTWNPLDKDSDVTLLNGNLDTTQSAAGATKGTIAVATGKWYWEITKTSTGNQTFGIATVSAVPSTYIGGFTSSAGFNSVLGDMFVTGSAFGTVNGSTVGTTNNGDVLGLALDLDGGTLKIYRNGTLLTANHFTISNAGSVTPAIGTNVSLSGNDSANFGQRAFAYPLSGFKALCDTNLPAPLTAKPNTVMDVKLYTGNGSTQTISGLGFSPDLVWIKERSGTRFHALCDSVRGDGLLLYSNSTSGEQNIGSSVVDLTSDGFNLGFNSGFTSVSHNWNAVTHVAWTWDAGTSTVSNTAGSITSQVRANVSAGFSVVTWTGTGSNATVGHGLGVAPQLLIIKRRSGANDWIVGHTSLGGWANFLYLNLTNATDTASTIFQSTAPTSTLFSLGTSTYVNGSSETYVAYCFAPVVGYSSFGIYTGNGLADGPFVYTGFRPRWVMIKRTDTAAQWVIWDSSRKAYNYQGPFFFAESSAAESADAEYLDFVSNGFKFRTTNSTLNQGTSIYIAFAENPFQYARAR